MGAVDILRKMIEFLSKTSAAEKIVLVLGYVAGNIIGIIQFNIIRRLLHLGPKIGWKIAIAQALWLLSHGLGIGWLTHKLIFTKNPPKQISVEYLSFPQFKDIVGCELPKRALMEAISFMKEPDVYKDFGVRQRRGILLYGPPGTGKTTLAKACARELKINFIAANASEFCEIYVGVGPKKVRDLFEKAKQCSSAIIFIDEIDAIGNRAKAFRSIDGAQSERSSTINQLLSEMDGFSTSSNVMVIGATNNIREVDNSLLRPGRFDLKIKVDLPNENDRFSMLKLHLDKKKKWSITNPDLSALSRKLQRCSGADIESLVNEAAYAAIRRKAPEITIDDLQSALRDTAII